MGKLRYYISGHGLGHASRSCQIINTLRRRHPRLAVEAVSTAHPWFFEGFLDPSVPVRRAGFDLGVLQRDSLVMREAQTLRAFRDWLPELERLTEEEARSLAADGVSLVAADIPAAPFAAAHQAGVPAVGISNFSWDWIYEPLAAKHPGYDEVLAALRRDYARADRLLRLPFHGELPAFRRVEDLPLVARRSRRTPEEVRRALGIEAGRRLGLISFGGFGLREFDFTRLGRLGGWVFLTEAPPSVPVTNLRPIPAAGFHYPDLVAAADAVITKPGYGIVSEAIAAGAAVLYTTRGDFREQALLVEGLRRFTRAREIDNDRLRQGEWGEELEALLAQPLPTETIAAEGDVVAADRLAALARGLGTGDW